MNADNSSSIAIIGGADGPTAIYISGDPTLTIIKIILALLIMAVILFLIFKKKPFKKS